MFVKHSGLVKVFVSPVHICLHEFCVYILMWFYLLILYFHVTFNVCVYSDGYPANCEAYCVDTEHIWIHCFSPIPEKVIFCKLNICFVYLCRREGWQGPVGNKKCGSAFVAWEALGVRKVRFGVDCRGHNCGWNRLDCWVE